MRQGPNKRSRGRNNGGNPNHNNNNNNNNGGRPRPPHRSQTFDSNGPGIKIRGNAYQVFERYVALAREATSAGDRVAAENYYQHAEHYFRIMNANGENPIQHMQRQQAQLDAEAEAEQAEADGENGDNDHGEARVQVTIQPQQPEPEPEPVTD
jgi:hypothetical protein